MEQEQEQEQEQEHIPGQFENINQSNRRPGRKLGRARSAPPRRVKQPIGMTGPGVL